MKRYDYIVCGAGCAGLTFLYEIISYENLKDKQILVIDTSRKTENDRTWCFWGKHPSNFIDIVKHQWKELNFKSDHFQNKLLIKPYVYNMINGLDFYQLILSSFSNCDNIEIKQENVISVENKENGVEVKTSAGTYLSEYAFNSIVFDKKTLETKNSLLQHFKGIEIETLNNVFNPDEATFMDFSINQEKGTSFMYVLPTAKNRALVEYTLFTKSILTEQEYDTALDDYIKNKLKITEYRIKHTEFGIIPMTDYKFKRFEGNIINLGTAAGCVKPSSGFAFNFIQRHTKQIVALLAQGKKPQVRRTFTDNKFHFYDAVLLEVIAQNKMKGSEVFTSIFKKNSPQLVLKFLDNQTNIWEDLKIMASVPTKIFLPIALKKIFTSK
jgi:lycopene beta-cyclase